MHALHRSPNGLLALLAGLLLCTGCRESGPASAPGPAPPPGSPNILLVVWDTVRADRLSLYGHDRPTTPKLDAWAVDARVYDDVLTTAGYTLPSHASLFTGLLPSEHCTHNGHPRLDDAFVTLAERLLAGGWNTFLFSANPHVSAAPTRNFAQGFQVAEHPWSERWRDEALAIVRRKLAPEDRSSELAERLAAVARGERAPTAWNIKAAGALAERALLAWLQEQPGDRPWFAFLNYMEAHRPLIPPREAREAVMEPGDVAASYRVDRSWLATWEYSFGLREMSPRELELTRATYDAALRELDGLFASLLEGLERAGQLANTVVVLVSDHGEHLGEQHMLDHQYSVYQPVLRVPLVIHAPGRVPAGRDSRSAVHFDLYPTLLALAGLEVPPDLRARDLLAPARERVRLAEDPVPSRVGIEQVQAEHPGWDPAPFQVQQRAVVAGARKLIWRSDGGRRLYQLDEDPWETADLAGGDVAATQRLETLLAHTWKGLDHCDPAALGAVPEPGPDERRMLEELGYLAPAASPSP